MKLILSISWRNIWRHPARSGVLLGAIIAGIWAGMTLSALTNGMIDQRFANMIQEDLTHLQVHQPQFLTEREPAMYMPNADSILKYLQNDTRVESAAARTLVDGMIQSSLTTSGVSVRGVDPVREPETTTFHENLIYGNYLDSDVRNPILLGKRLAEKLNVQIGNRIVLTFQDVNSELSSAAFTISGIFRTNSGPQDERVVFVRSDDLSSILAGQQIYHEIAVMLQNEEMSNEVASDLNNRFDGISAETWYELSPELRYLNDFGNTMTVYIMIVIMLALAFGILNTMLMAIFERMRELGMLMAVGMSKTRIFSMIMTESVVLTFLAAAAGMVLGYVSINMMSENGLDLSAVGGDSLAEFGYDSVIYPFVTGADIVNTAIIVILTALLAAVYPAIKALSLNPGEVVRE
ncbi:ABC transporter permease [Rhodohalobacter mucosus]|uniref:ABC transporter permease n=1 Tax=Rhodohalobacter mucosus TaxID=2079485 RepID=A0A316TSR6_9BACT|nr:FtsX-like permease family protein [Rhodohalobacter mucosus]PWN07663.1 ABC transporter permease [Rhodohalobacter mucosus]